MIFKKDVSEYTPDELEPVTDLGRHERESAWSAMEDEDFYDVYVTDNVVLSSLKQLMKKAPAYCYLRKVHWLVDGGVAGYSFKVSKKCIRWQAPRVLSDEERQHRAALMKANRRNHSAT